MAELNLKQIIDRLNTEFTGETRKLVFWYDDKAEFEEDMDSVELENKSYNKCVAMLRENNIPFGYLHGVNPDITIKQIYDSLEI